MISLTTLSADNGNIERCAKALAAGELVAFPTETVYGLGADATNDNAVASIFAAKNRPDFNPLIVHVTDREAAARFVEFNSMADRLAKAFWPGALSLVLPRRADCGLSLLVSAGLDSVAIRVPAHPMAHDLLERADCPIAAPSANRSGEVSPTTAAHVAQSFARLDADPALTILDGGPCRVGLESTVIDVSNETATLLRPGGIPPEAIEHITGPLIRAGSNDQAPKSPGMLSRHYAPRTPLRLNADSAQKGEVLLGFGVAPVSTDFNLSPSGDLAEAAANLFAMLRKLDEQNHAGIAVMPVPDEGLGLAINDRLQRAAT
ncbi:MAG: threonylcarbamoyl-AMP synthase [Rhodospirillaceae bacterium]|nr:threonylcarbamoyl-AMP synthase [Rhodospirillaceae bacterium]